MIQWLFISYLEGDPVWKKPLQMGLESMAGQPTPP